MRKLSLFVFFLLLFILFQTSSAQIFLRGYLQSSLYSWEPSQTQLNDYYQGLRFRIGAASHPGIYLNSYLRLARRGNPADWKEKVYNLYLNGRLSKQLQFRLGRQFLYAGAITGTFDGLWLNGRVLPDLNFRLLVGTVAPYQRTFEALDWDQGNALGAFASYRSPAIGKLEVSFFQKYRSGAAYWRQVEAALTGQYRNALAYFARVDYNLLSSEFQGMRYRLTYRQPCWSLSGEYNSQKPRIYEDSFFAIFEVEAYNQFRLAGTYNISRLQLGLQYLYTILEEDNDQRLIGTVSYRYGTIGLVYQSGFGGDNLGLYGDVNYPILPRLWLKLYSSYYNYERAMTNLSQDALAFSAGLRYRLGELFVLSGEVQQSSNAIYKNDWRGLFRFTYLFDYK